MPYYRCPGCGLTVHSAAAYFTARTCPDCSAALPEDARLYLTPGGGRSIRRVLGARPEAVGKARRALVGLPVPRSVRDRLTLLVSELVTNSIRHAGLRADEPISVHITSRAGRVRLAVHDGGPGFVPAAPAGRDPLAVGGHGCAIVAALSDGWGVECDAGGCTVWCEVDTHEEPATALAREVTSAYVEEMAIEMAAPARHLI
jgi:anti-sigma regulatory factor (Ser/Thr protein kinase)